MSSADQGRSSERVVVVGGSISGLRAAEALRKAAYAGEVLVIGAEPQMPYNRPPLSKQALTGDLDLESLLLRVPKAAADVSWRLGARVTTADLTARTVTLDTGEQIGWEGLVVASGLAPRRLPLAGPVGGLYTLRSLADAEVLRSAMVPGARMVVIGAGFIGCEVAAAARGLGVEVEVVAPEAVPIERPLGHLLGAALQARHEQHGVRFHLGVVPVELRGTDRVTSVLLSDGSELPCELIMEAVGAAPVTGWLGGNGLDLSDGLRCDGLLRVEGRPEVVACGDLARFPNALFDDVPRRVEHWTMATDTARRAGRSLGLHLTGADDPDPTFAPVPSFWSDQYDLRMQSFGAPALGADDVRVLEGELHQTLEQDVAVGYHRDGRLVGVVLVGMGDRHRYFHDEIAALLPG